MRLITYLIAGGVFLVAGCQTVASKPSQIEKPNYLISDRQTTAKAAPEPAPIVINDVWERIRLGLKMPVPDQKLVNYYRDWYIKHPNHLAQVSERSVPFMYLIVDKLEKRNLPVELALLPIVESSFDPFAYSHGAASGLWQFTTPMAKYFGLQMNWWYDGRRDVPAATDAALDMMEYLYTKTHQNWLYAMAAYNTGEGRVRNAVKQSDSNNTKTDFWSLNLPSETERYVPQLLALADVIKNADKYGIKLAPIPNKPYVEIIDIGSQIDLAYAAKLANMSLKELHSLNPGYNRWATAPNGPHNLVVPIGKAEHFKLELAKTKAKDRLKWVRYKVKSGDSIGKIAQKYNTTIGVLRSVNELDSNTIYAGKHLLIPVASQNEKVYTLSQQQRLKHKQNIKRANYRMDHLVQSGDSLWKIAKNNKVTIDRLAAWNNMAPKDPLKIGQKLVIWTNTVSSNQTASSVMRKVHYKVRNGESIARIANKFNVTIHDVIRWNSLEKQKYIQPGQTLKLYVDVTKVSI